MTPGLNHSPGWVGSEPVTALRTLLAGALGYNLAWHLMEVIGALLGRKGAENFTDCGADGLAQRHHRVRCSPVIEVVLNFGRRRRCEKRKLENHARLRWFELLRGHKAFDIIVDFGVAHRQTAR